MLWESAEGGCLRGRWLPVEDLICFAYEDFPEDLRCWSVSLEEGGVIARLPGADPRDALREIGRSQEPLTCPGPSLGV